MDLLADCMHIKGFTFLKCFIILIKLILFSLGRVVSCLVLLGKKLKLKCQGVTCSRSPQAHNKLSWPQHYSNYSLCCQPSVIDYSL